MTRKHFKAIANILSTVRNTEGYDKATVAEIAVRKADYLSTTNELFNEQRFLDATN